jgi:hypothetical protein
LTYTKAIHNLSVQFDKLHDKQRQAALLAQAFGSKGAKALMPTFEKGTKAVDALSGGSFFTKISTGSLDDFQNIWSGLKKTTTAVSATLVNIIDAPFRGLARLSQYLGAWSGGARNATQMNAVLQQQKQAEEDLAEKKAFENQADEDGISVAEEKAKIIEQQNSLLEKQAELQSDITDRDKESVDEMASSARKALGIKSPLEMISHTVTPRQITALKIKTLEDMSKAEWMMGDDVKSQKIQSEADQLRASNPWMKRNDVNPMVKTETELAQVNIQLAPIKRQAEMILKMQ